MGLGLTALQLTHLGLGTDSSGGSEEQRETGDGKSPRRVQRRKIQQDLGIGRSACTAPLIHQFTEILLRYYWDIRLIYLLRHEQAEGWENAGTLEGLRALTFFLPPRVAQTLKNHNCFQNTYMI